MKKINVTFSISTETHELLHSLIEKRKMSSFVSTALNKALIEKKEALKKAYIEAEKDLDRITTIEDWKDIEGEDWE